MDIDISRYKNIKVGKGYNKRQAELKMFADRMPSISPQLIAIKMSHLSTDELHETYQLIDKKARNFTAFWFWHFMPKKNDKKS